MEEFIAGHKYELLITAITVVVLLLLRYAINKAVRKIGKISDIIEARTLLITKYVSGLLTFLGIGAMTFIWGLDYREVGVMFSSAFAVIGVALFASWSILSNITAGVILFFSFPFKIGDRVKILDKDTESEEPYIIEDIKAFHVNLRKDNGELLVYPNNLMIQKAITLVYYHSDIYDGSDDSEIL